MSRITPTDIVAIIVLVACFILIARGVDSYVTGVSSVVIGYYFGRRKSAENHIKELEEKSGETE